MKPDVGGPLSGMAVHWFAAGSSPQAWIAATLAILVKALALTPTEAVAVFAVIGLCLLSEALELMADVKEGRGLDLKNLRDGVWRLAAYLAVPALLALAQLAFIGSEELWETALWGCMALFASKEGAAASAALHRLGVELPKKVVHLIEGDWRRNEAAVKQGDERDA